ncbi:MAG TPA: serine hydrolase domain-containing protein [Terriglobales bacterium]|jgi:D-alanyl-D-alanine carboxypeptidase|nr:serine hydrolase domain-containing protein [Terriglobales bacterium]
MTNDGFARLIIMRIVKLLPLALFVSFAAFGQTASQPQLPDTPAAHQFSAWLEAFNRGDRQAYSDFLQKDFPSRVPRLDQHLSFRERTGGFDFRKLVDSSPTKLVVLVQERVSDQFAKLTLEVDEAAPHNILSMEVTATDRPADFPVPHLSESELIAATRKRVEQDVAADRFAGAVLIARNGKPIFEEAYGLADREHKIPNKIQTRFRVGSMNKMFTAVAILQLVEAGKLGLNDPLGKFLPDYPNKEVATKVTIHHLLTHTGGTGDIFGPEFDAHRLDLHTLQDYVKLYGNRELKFDPGSQWDYSNYGFILLGVVIENVSKENYYDYVRTHIYEPAGMNLTGAEPEDRAVTDRSVGYTKTEPGTPWRTNVDTLPYRGSSAGGGYSTVEDLLKFATALEQNKLLNAHNTELLTTGKVDTPNGRYGYGFGDHMINGARCFGHTGGAPGMNGDLEICPSAGFVVAVLSNLDPPAAIGVSDFITNRLPEK